MFVDSDEPDIQKLNRAINVEHGMVEVDDRILLGVPISHACFITSKRPEAHVGAS